MSTAQVQQQPPQLHTGRDLSSSSNMSFASNDPTIGGISSSNGNTQDLFSNNPLKNSLSSNALKQLASRNAPSSPGGGGGGLSRGLESNDEAYQRAVSRIASLEATLEYQKVLHADQLKGLHEEVHRLQSICSDLNMRLVMKEGVVPPSQNGGNGPQKHRKGTVGNLPKHTSASSGTSSLGLPSSTSSSDVIGLGGSVAGRESSIIQPNNRASRVPGSNRIDSMDMISERDVGGSALLSHSGSQSGSSREGGGTNFTSGGGGGLSGKVGDAGTTSTMVGGGGGIVVASNMESNEPLSLLLQKQKSKYVAVIERSQVEIKRYRVEAERLRSEVSILKDVLSISTGIRFDAKDLKEAVTAYQNATMHIEMHRFATKVGGVGSVGGAPPAAEKGHGGAMRAKTANGMKVLPPIEKKGDSSNNNNINNKQAKVTTETTLTHHETGTISQQQQQQQHHEEPVHLSDEELSILTTARQRIASDLLILKNNSKPNGKIDREVEGGGDGGGEGEEEMSSITTIPPIEMPLLPTKLSESFNKRVMGIQAIRKKQHKELFDRT